MLLPLLIAEEQHVLFSVSPLSRICNPTERGAYIRTIRMIRGLRLVGFVIRRHGV